MNRTGEHGAAVKEDELPGATGHPVWDHSPQGGMRQAQTAPVPR